MHTECTTRKSMSTYAESLDICENCEQYEMLLAKSAEREEELMNKLKEIEKYVEMQEEMTNKDSDKIAEFRDEIERLEDELKQQKQENIDIFSAQSVGFLKILISSDLLEILMREFR